MRIVYIRVASVQLYGDRMKIMFSHTRKRGKELIRLNTIFIRSNTTEQGFHKTVT